MFAGSLEERSDAEIDLIWHLLDLRPGLRVLDLACGHGRIFRRGTEPPGAGPGNRCTLAGGRFGIELNNYPARPLAAGFSAVIGFGEDGGLLTTERRRMITVAVT